MIFGISSAKYLGECKSSTGEVLKFCIKLGDICDWAEYIGEIGGNEFRDGDKGFKEDLDSDVGDIGGSEGSDWDISGEWRGEFGTERLLSDLLSLSLMCVMLGSNWISGSGGCEDVIGLCCGFCSCFCDCY